MFCLKYIENDNHIMWLKNFMKRDNVFFKSFSSFLLLKNKDISYLDDIYSKDILKSKTIDEHCGFNKDIILYSDKCKIYNYDLAKKLVAVSSNLM